MHLSQSGLGLPDEAYYREDAYAEIRTAYVEHLARLAELVGLPDPAGLAATVMDLETRARRRSLGPRHATATPRRPTRS